jgi:hypothetical protein
MPPWLSCERSLQKLQPASRRKWLVCIMHIGRLSTIAAGRWQHLQQRPKRLRERRAVCDGGQLPHLPPVPPLLGAVDLQAQQFVYEC